MDKPLFAAEYLLLVVKPLTKWPDLVLVDMETDENRGIMLEVTFAIRPISLSSWDGMAVEPRRVG